MVTDVSLQMLLARLRSLMFDRGVEDHLQLSGLQPVSASRFQTKLATAHGPKGAPDIAQHVLVPTYVILCFS